MGEPTRFSQSLDDSKAVELTGKIMVVAIIVFFVVVVFVIFLQLYAKWFWWRIEEDAASSAGDQQSRRRRRRFVFAPGQDPTVATTLRRGLEPSVLRSLPVVIYRAEDFKEGLECAVCLSELANGEKARLLPKCNHGFHLDCIDMWFQSHSTCPLCRNSVAPESSSNSAGSETVRSPDENSASDYTADFPNFPTNVLFWGDDTQVSSGNACLEEGPSQSQPSVAAPSTSSSAAAASRINGALVIDIPSENPASSSSSSQSPDELKSPVPTRLRSLKRLLSRERRVNSCSPSSGDIEQANRGPS